MNINNYCLNCDKVGHISRTCNQPITSYGIICFNINNKLLSNIENYCYNKFINIHNYNYKYINNISLMPKYVNTIKLLMIMRKHSLTYIEFIRGKYNINNIDDIRKLLILMTINENTKIRTDNFDTLWSDLWMLTANNKIFKKEYFSAKDKFTRLKELNFYNILDNSCSKYIDPEWGFPKGRKNINENIKSCAIREFNEETMINDTVLIDHIDTIQELYVGTNNINYRNIYYLGYNRNTKINYDPDYSFETGDIKWLTVNECIDKLRPYEKHKTELIYNTYYFLLNLIINSK